ncbi:hypothetical protein AA15669_1658 [Saccharibacter floricola DSM 15669]|uniref:Cellulose biosynthesis protein BcsE n=2 Tax=Saccharibacter TaxID=231052 RepID=A0ABQ0P0R2_9PROT|nr:hypothetical protein AA15669_1658 [Saccharibacter floricola DSM 15669]
MTSALLTYDLRVLCMEHGKLIARALDTLADLTHVVSLQWYNGGWNLVTHTPERWWYDINAGCFDRCVPEARIEVEGDLFDAGICRLTGLDGYFHAQLSGAITPFGAMAHRRECRFRLLDGDDVRALWHVMKERWVLGDHQRLAQACSGESTIWEIHFGRLVVEFKDFLIAARERQRLSQQALLVMAERSIHRAVPYKPVVFYSLTQAEQLAELALSLRSLVECGRYQGNVCIASAMPAQRVEAFIPAELKGRYRLVRLSMGGERDKAMPLLASLVSGMFDDYAPVVCLKSSVLVTRPIDKTLRRFAQGGSSLGAPVEHVFEGDDVPQANKHGAFLGAALPEGHKIRYGFTMSVVVLPSTRQQKIFLEEALRSAVSYLGKPRHPAYAEYEAGIFHYVAAVLGAFDPALLTQRDCNLNDPAMPGQVDGTFLCCEEWLDSHRTALMRSHLESLPRTVS